MESFEIVEAALHNILLVRIIQVVNEFVFCFYLEKGRRWWPSLLGVVACDSHHDVVFIRRHCRCVKTVLIIIAGIKLWLYWLCCDFEAGLKADYFFVECCELLLCEVGGIICIDFLEYLHKRHWFCFTILTSDRTFCSTPDPSTASSRFSAGNTNYYTRKIMIMMILHWLQRWVLSTFGRGVEWRREEVIFG